jgi:hypothetical protein
MRHPCQKPRCLALAARPRLGNAGASRAAHHRENFRLSPPESWTQTGDQSFSQAVVRTNLIDQLEASAFLGLNPFHVTVDQFGLTQRERQHREDIRQLERREPHHDLFGIRALFPGTPDGLEGHAGFADAPHASGIFAQGNGQRLEGHGFSVAENCLGQRKCNSSLVSRSNSSMRCTVRIIIGILYSELASSQLKLVKTRSLNEWENY